ncbi:5,10-methylene tetrahydromethanopterin reductase, partial [Burkholderia sp. 4701]|nr:5,10-methylene tetrahydromethanopterin reductase [Burkholderia sp. 4701]
DVVELVVPELQRRGAYQTDYAPGTLRAKLHRAGPRLPAPHPAARYRVGGEPAAAGRLAAQQ